MNVLNTKLNNFVNTGEDSRLSKSYHMEEVLVHGKYGTYMAKRRKGSKNDRPHQNPKNRKQEAFSYSLVNEDYLYMPMYGGKSYRTLEQVVEEFHSNKNNERDFGSINSFIELKYFASTGKNTTADAYRKSQGRYVQERFDRVHRPIIQEILDSGDTPKNRKPICLIYGGGSGSGKSSVADKWIAEPMIERLGLNFAKVDCDDIKSKLPEHEMFLKQNEYNAAAREHRESSDIANEAIDELIKNGKCFRYDGTMSDADKYINLIDKLKGNGYEVHVIATDLPVEEAIRRANLRSRKINEEIVRKTHRGFGESFLDIATYEGVDSFRLYDNSQPEGENPTLIADADRIYDNSLWTRFMNKNNH